jgi:beta-glucosidase-like glycosyl hydrolase
MSDEARALYNAKKDGPRSPHGLVYRSPVINISRDPRWGRIQEVFSEDPYLTGRMAVAYVKGLQGEDVAHLKLASTLKHFAVNNVEAGRQHLSAIVDDRNLFDFWFPHWKAGFMEGKAQSVMSSYNAINGVPSAVNRWLLTDVLRGQWGFDGFVTDDLGAVQLLTSERPNEPGHRFSDDPVVSTAAAIKAGNDSDDQEFEDNIPKAVQRGLLTMSDVDKALANVLRVGFRLGAFDPETPYDRIPMSVVRSEEHLALSLKVAQASLTLLSNRSASSTPAAPWPDSAVVPAAEEGRDQDGGRHRAGRRPGLSHRELLRHARAQSRRCDGAARAARIGRPGELREGRGLRRARRSRVDGEGRCARQTVRRRGALPSAPACRSRPKGATGAT